MAPNIQADARRRSRGAMGLVPRFAQRLVTDPGFVLPPDFYWRTFGEGFADLRQTGGELFLKTAISESFCA